MEGQIDLVEGRGRQQRFLLPGQQGTVGGEDDPESQVPGPLQQLRQLGMQQGFPHDMEVEILAVGPQAAGQNGKFLHRQELCRAGGAGAETARQIAAAGDLQIQLGKHGVPSLSALFSLV